MKLTITDVNFTSDKKWLFKLENESTYFIMDSEYYRINKLKNPLTKKNLDSLDKGSVIDVNFKEIHNKKIVIEIY